MSDSTLVTPELLAGFLDEAPEYLSILDEGVLAFEAKAGAQPITLEDPVDQARMNEMFRAAHSLKGLGAAMGFDKIRDLTHLMETLFDHVRMGKRPLDAAGIETLFGVFDKLRELVQELSDPPAQPVAIEEALEALRTILNAPVGAAVGGTPSRAGAPVIEPAPDAPVEFAPLTAPAADAATPAAQKRSGSGVLDDPELAQLFVETTTETIEELNQNLLKLEDAPNDVELLNEVFRCAHNIKGATGAAGCEGLYRLTHDMESVLDRVRTSKLELDEAISNALFAAVDRLRSDIELVRAGDAAKLGDSDTTGRFAQWMQEAPPAAPAAGGGAMDGPPVEDFGDDVVHVRATFPKDFAESEIQAFLIRGKLDEVGDVVGTAPDVENLTGSSTLEVITYHVRTTAPASELEQLVRSFSVADVTVSGVGDDHAVAEAGAPNAARTEVSATPAEPAPAPKPATAAARAEAKAPPAPRAEPRPAPTPANPKPVAPAAPAVPAVSAVGAAKTGGDDDAKKPPAAKVGETLRVDLERLDQLMNLGGELVINKARFVQIQSRFDPLFSGQNVGYLVDDITDRFTRLQRDVSKLMPTAQDRRVIEDLSDTLLHLSHDFDTVKGLVNRVHDCRGAMNDFSEALHSLNRISEGMQRRIMETRMVSIGPLFQRFRRVVRDIAKATHKDVELELHGEATELDKRMIDELGDPLTHMVRNSVDHGIEPPEERERLGKPRTATVTLNAYHRGRHICIEVRDDGRGVNLEAVRRKILEKELATPAQVEQMSDKELVQYIFRPGFSTAQQVTDLSGRGMGLDIVMTKLEHINGTVEVDTTPGKGTVVTIKLPLTLAIITSLLARIGKGVYAIPLEMVAEIITVPQSKIQSIQRQRVIRVRDAVIPVAMFEHVFATTLPELQTATKNHPDLTLVILSFQDDRVGLVVDEMIGQEDVVIKNLATNYRNVAGIAGASIMGDGSVSLILDVAAVMTMFAERGPASPRGETAPAGRSEPAATAEPTGAELATVGCEDDR